METANKKWAKRFLKVAAEIATWSKDTTQVGCVIVSEDGLIISTGYNGIPRGVLDLPSRLERPAKYLWVAHGEEAALANAARHGARTAGATLFCTHTPCSRCARQIINAGVCRVVAGSGTTSMPAEEFEASIAMFAEAGVVVEAAR